MARDIRVIVQWDVYDAVFEPGQTLSGFGVRLRWGEIGEPGYTQHLSADAREAVFDITVDTDTAIVYLAEVWRELDNEDQAIGYNQRLSIEPGQSYAGIQFFLIYDDTPQLVYGVAPANMVVLYGAALSVSDSGSGADSIDVKNLADDAGVGVEEVVIAADLAVAADSAVGSDEVYISIMDLVVEDYGYGAELLGDVILVIYADLLTEDSGSGAESAFLSDNGAELLVNDFGVGLDGDALIEAEVLVEDLSDLVHEELVSFESGLEE